MCSKNIGEFMKGMGLGVAVGGVLGTVGVYCVQKNKKGLKHNAGKAMHSIGDLLEHVTDMF